MLTINIENVNYFGVKFKINVKNFDFRELYDFNDAVSFARFIITYGIYKKQDVTINVTLTEILPKEKGNVEFKHKEHILCVIKFDD